MPLFYVPDVSDAPTAIENANQGKYTLWNRIDPLRIISTRDKKHYTCHPNTNGTVSLDDCEVLTESKQRSRSRSRSRGNSTTRPLETDAQRACRILNVRMNLEFMFRNAKEFTVSSDDPGEIYVLCPSFYKRAHPLPVLKCQATDMFAGIMSPYQAGSN